MKTSQSLAKNLLFVIAFGLCKLNLAIAHDDKALYAGLALFSENSLGKITDSPSAEKNSGLGTSTYPLIFKYDWKISNSYFFSPIFTYTLFSRKDPGDSAQVSIWHLILPFGRNFGSDFEWYAGPGILSRTIKGAGGFQTLNNGAGTTVFAVPGRSVTSRVVSINVGSAYNFNQSRVAFDLVTEGAASSKRTFDLMFSYSYAFSRGF